MAFFFQKGLHVIHTPYSFQNVFDGVFPQTKKIDFIEFFFQISAHRINSAKNAVDAALTRIKFVLNLYPVNLCEKRQLNEKKVYKLSLVEMKVDRIVGPTRIAFYCFFSSV